MPYDCAFALINERLPLLVVKCSAISRRVFPALRTHRSLREPLPQFRCHHLALATQLALAQKALFLRFSFSFTSLIPCLLSPREEREKTERTTAQLPANKKCCLLIFAIAIGCLVLAAIPASSLQFPSGHSGTSGIAVPLPHGCPALRVPETLVASWGALCGSAREKSLCPLKNRLKSDFYLHLCKKCCIFAVLICFYY